MAFSTDTRTLREGDIYVAIRGERYDGHDFVQEAFQRGASKAVVERSVHGVSTDRLEIVRMPLYILLKSHATRLSKHMHR